jgi:hypothetical protein
MEMTVEKFARKMWYAYFQAYDVTLICSLFVRLLYSNYMLYNKKTYRKHSKKLCKNIVKLLSIYNEISQIDNMRYMNYLIMSKNYYFIISFEI